MFMKIKEMKRSTIADHLEMNIIDNYKLLDFVPDKVVMIVETKPNNWESEWWTMYFNIHVNVLGNGTKAVIISLNSHQYPISISLQFECTNNMVEYETYTRGFEAP